VRRFAGGVEDAIGLEQHGVAGRRRNERCEAGLAGEAESRESVSGRGRWAVRSAGSAARKMAAVSDWRGTMIE
jgi:hypothetical protein